MLNWAIQISGTEACLWECTWKHFECWNSGNVVPHAD